MKNDRKQEINTEDRQDRYTEVTARSLARSGDQQLVKATHTGLLTAIEIVLSRFFSIATPIVKIGFGFLPLAMVGMMYGPVYSALSGAIADFLGALLFPIGPYFPGFTLTAGLSGMLYGLMLHNKPKSWGRITLVVLLISLVLHLGLDTLWLQMITGKGYLVLLPARILKSVIMAPMQIIMIRLTWTRICPILLRRSAAK